MKKILIILFLPFQLVLLGQSSLGLKLDIGASKISNNPIQKENDWDNKFDFSGNAGIVYSYKFKGKSMIGTGILISKINGRESTVFTATNNVGDITGTFDLGYKKHISYLSLPLYYGYQINKLTINAGVQFSMMLSSSLETIDESHIINFDSGSLYIDDFAYGTLISLNYAISNKLSIEGTYYYGLNNILRDNPSSNWVWKIQQVTIGVRYLIFTGTTKAGLPTSSPRFGNTPDSDETVMEEE